MMFLTIVCLFVKPTLSWLPNSPTSKGISCATSAKVAISPVSLPPIKKAPPSEIPSTELWNRCPTKNERGCVVRFVLSQEGRW